MLTASSLARKFEISHDCRLWLKTRDAFLVDYVISAHDCGMYFCVFSFVFVLRQLIFVLISFQKKPI